MAFNEDSGEIRSRNRNQRDSESDWRWTQALIFITAALLLVAVTAAVIFAGLNLMG